MKLLALAVLLFALPATILADDGSLIEVDTSLPALPGVGVAGALAGTSSNHLIIAGGANFPNAPLWETEKVWHDAIHVLDLASPSDGWSTLEPTLPRATAYGVSLTHPTFGVISVGGADGTTHLDNAFMMTFNDGELVVEPLPNLPTPLAYAAGAIDGDIVYIVGGQTSPDATVASDRLFRLNLASLPHAWEELEPLPAAGRILPVAGVNRGALYVFSGASLAPNKEGKATRTYLTDAWRFAPAEGWDQREDLPRPTVAAPNPAIPLGHDFLLVIGGSDGSLDAQVNTLRDDHPGFPRSMLAYHPITDRWSHRGSFPSMPPVTSNVVPIDGGFVLASGEVRPRVRTPNVTVLRSLDSTRTLATLDWIAIGLYAIVLIGMGLYFMGRENSTDDFFLAGRRIPWWAAGISIFATQLSAITFMAIPAKSYDTNWILFIQNLGILALVPIVAYCFLPFFRRLSVTTAYEYLEYRFHVSLRLAGSAVYMCFQVGRVAIVTLLPSLALAAVTGFDVTACILGMGAICILYTVLGGIEAVIWSDVLQTVVLIGGAAWALCAMTAGVDGGVSAIVNDAMTSEKLQLADMRFDFSEPTILVVILGALFINIIPYASDQSVVQRYLTTKDEAASRKAIWTSGLLAVPASLIFFALGTSLWAYYRANPESLEPTSKLDQILPFFLVDQLPAGVGGLVIAGLFAAAMSSLDSSMNSVSTAFTTDFYARFRPETTDHQRLRVAKIATVAIGVIGTGAALLMAALNDASLLDTWFKIIGLFGSALAGIFILGAISRRAGSIAGWCGLLAGALSVFLVSTLTDLNGILYAAVGIMSCLVVGVVVAIFCPNQKDLQGLTLATLRK
jgi:SSS family solute:Na+ symporter